MRRGRTAARVVSSDAIESVGGVFAENDRTNRRDYQRPVGAFAVGDS